MDYVEYSFLNAACSGDFDLIQERVDQGVDLSVLDEYGQSIVTITAMMGRPDDLDQLLAIIKKPDLPDADGKTALAYAIRQADLPRIEILLKHGADTGRIIDPYYRENCLHLAMRSLRTAPLITSRLVRASRDDALIATNLCVEPPLFLAIYSATLLAMQPLLMELNWRDIPLDMKFDGVTAYQEALKRNRHDVAAAIRELGG